MPSFEQERVPTTQKEKGDGFQTGRLSYLLRLGKRLGEIRDALARPRTSERDRADLIQEEGEIHALLGQKKTPRKKKSRT